MSSVVNDITDRRFLNVITFISHINIELLQLFLHELKRTSILLPWSCFGFLSVTRSLGLAHDGGQILKVFGIRFYGLPISTTIIF